MSREVYIKITCPDSPESKIIGIANVDWALKKLGFTDFETERINPDCLIPMDENKIPKVEFLKNLFSWTEGPGWKYIGDELIVKHKHLLSYIKKLIEDNGEDIFR